MVKRRSIGPGVSFFAFQDIITAVVGIFILIILILVLELAQRVEAASSGQTENVTPVVETIEQLEVEVARLREEVRQRSDDIAESAELNSFNRKEKLAQQRAKQRATASRLAQVEAQIARVREQQAKAEKEHDRLLSEAAELNTQRQAIKRLNGETDEVLDRTKLLAGEDSAVYRDKTEGGRFIVLVTLSPSQIELRDAMNRSVETMRGRGRLSRMRDWLERSQLGRRQLFLLIEPGGSADFVALKQALEDSGAVYGFSVVESNHSVRLGFELGQLP